MRKPIFLYLALHAAVAQAQSLAPSQQQTRILARIVHYVFQDSFSSAYDASRRLQDTIPGHPLHNLAQASILHAQMYDAEDYSREEKFASHVDSTIGILKKWTSDWPDDAWGHFFLGSAYAYKAIWQGQKGSWLKSLFTGLKAKGRFAKALKLNPELYDAYTGMGNYHYWSSAKLGKYVPFIPDKREQGLRELRVAMDSSYFSAEPAATGLAWALINEKRYAQAAKVGQWLFEQTNGGRNSLWILAGVYWRIGNLKKAADYYGRLIESLERAGDQNYYNLIFCRYRKGVSLFGLGDYAGARNEFETLLSYNPDKEIRDRHKETYEKAREYLERIKKRSAGSHGR